MNKVKNLTIKNFRGIKELIDFPLNNLSILIGNNGTSKTTILEALNFCLSPSFLSGRIKHTDFHSIDEPIEIILELEQAFRAMLPDGYQKQEVLCKKISLKIKRRERAGNNKAFSDIVTVDHYVVPVQAKSTPQGWTQLRSGGSPFKFDERLLSYPVATDGNLRSYYFGKNREKQIQRGFNTSMESVYEDFNWRFVKEMGKEAEKQEDFAKKKKEVESAVWEAVDKKSKEKTFERLNQKLEHFGLQQIAVSIFDGASPFDTAFLNNRIGELEIPISQLGSGIEMIISLLFLETMAALSKESFIIIIDEPELHLHPLLQSKLLEYLIGLAGTNQVIVSTHSPYLFKNCIAKSNVDLVVTRKLENNISVLSHNSGSKLFPWSPSWGEINYNAYDLPTVELHNELYGYIQESQGPYNEKAIEAYFVANGTSLNKSWVRMHQGIPQSSYPVTLSTYIRHQIHHPENSQNIPYTSDELRASVQSMIDILLQP